MLSQRRRRLSVLSSTCQHVATLQFFSGAKTDKFRAFSRPHPCFRLWRRDCGFALESLPAKTGICILLRQQCFSVVAQATPQDRARPAQGYFRMKDVDRRIEAIAQVNVESKEEKVERAEFNVPTFGHIAVCQRCRDKQIQSLFPTSSLFSTLKVRLRVCPGKPARQNRHMYTP